MLRPPRHDARMAAALRLLPSAELDECRAGTPRLAPTTAASLRSRCIQPRADLERFATNPQSSRGFCAPPRGHVRAVFPRSHRRKRRGSVETERKKKSCGEYPELRSADSRSANWLN